MKTQNKTKSAKINKESVGLAGEYAVASELCKRGFYAQLTLGNHKKTDLIVESNNKLFRVSVKSKQGSTWPKVTGIWAPGDLLVFVDFEGKSNDERPDFYVLGVDQWKSLVKKLHKSIRAAIAIIFFILPPKLQQFDA
ncbi:MAG: hypothetical protein D4R39_00910 [Methylophilaceae bacterium]|nr:MAG: hypothetical protein D4R39_00910 [Methylophilaceae bacterium]